MASKTTRGLMVAAASLFLTVTIFQGRSIADDESPPAIEKVWATLEGEPFQSFQRARERFLAEDFEEAARFIRKGAAFLWLETERAETAQMKGLEKAAAGLSKIAGQVEAQQVYHGRSLEAAFAGAHIAMARQYCNFAQKYEAAGELQAAARSMDICGGHLLSADFWASENLPAEDVAGIKKSRSDLRKVEKGGKGAETSLKEAFQKLDRGMEKTSKYLRFYEAEPE